MTHTELLITDPSIDDRRDRVRDAVEYIDTNTHFSATDIDTDDPTALIDTLTRGLTDTHNGHGLTAVTSGDTVTLILIDDPSPEARETAVATDIDVIFTTVNPYDFAAQKPTLTLIINELIDDDTPLVAPTHVSIERPYADDLLSDDQEQDADADENNQDEQGPEDLPPGTEWIDGHPAPAAGDEHDGRPPIGYTVSDSELRPTDEYADVRYYLVSAEEGRITTRGAASRIDASETTIKRILHDPDRRRRYALDVRVDAGPRPDQ